MFRAMVLEKCDGSITLNGQQRCGFNYAVLPSRFGICKYAISVKCGKLRLNHMAYNPDGGTWSCPPQNRQQAHHDLIQGQTYEITVIIGKHLDKLKRLILSTKALNGKELTCA